MKTTIFAALLCASVMTGCANPNAIGVQNYGTVTGTVIDARTQKPIPNALASIGSTITRYTGTDGVFTLVMVPEGAQTVVVSAGGYTTTSVQVTVTANQTTVVQSPVALQPVGP